MVQVTGDEMDAATDAAHLQGFHEGVAAQAAGLGVDAQDEQVPGVALLVRGQAERRQRQAGEALQVAFGEGLAARVERVQALELDQREGGVEVGQVVFETGLDHFRLRLASMAQAVVGIDPEAVELEAADPFGEGTVVADEHRAFGAGQVLDRVEGKDRRAAGAYRAPAVFAADRVGGVLDQGDAVAPGDRAQAFEIQGGAGVVNRHDGAGARADGGFHCLRRTHQGVAVDVDEHRGGAEQGDDVGGGDPGQRRRDHFVAGADAQRQQGDVQGAGGRG